MPSVLRTVAVDAMGADTAPGPEVEGAVRAVNEGLAQVILVGDQARLLTAVEAERGGPEALVKGLRVHHAGEVITMGDHPAAAVRAKKDSSMRVCFDLVERGDAHAVVSAGNSGAMLACGLFVMKRLPGVERPGILTTFPSASGVCALLDMGANVECRPQNLAQFAVLGATYARLQHRKSTPRVGLLSNGEEAHKGTELTRATHELLRAGKSRGLLDFEYLGYVEGKDIFGGRVDVVVTDGFTGNIVLKTAEGAGQVLFGLLKAEILRTVVGKLGAVLLRDAFARLKKILDYDEQGGAPLVGIDGVAIICHGRSNAKAIKNGVRVAAELSQAGLVPSLTAAISRHAPLWATETNKKAEQA